MISDIALTLFFVVLNGFFVAAEFAIVKVRISQIEMRLKSGNKLAGIAKNIVENLDAYLSATQLGITLASLGLGWIGESVVAEMIADFIHYFGIQIDDDTIHSISLPISFGIITVLHIVFGELAPKSAAIQKPEQMTLGVSIPLRIFYLIFRPFIVVLNGLANLVLRIIGLEGVSEESELHTPEEIKYLVEESEKGGVLNKEEKELIKNIFEFAQTQVKAVMVPRQKIIAVDISLAPEQIIDKIMEEGYSRIPVYEDEIDNIIGILYAKDLISLMLHRKLIVIQDLLRPPFYVNEEDMIDVVLASLKSQKIHLAVVQDEFGSTSGLITMEDIIEEIVGEIQDEYDEEEPEIVNKKDGVFVALAETSIPDANNVLPRELPEGDEYESIGGLFINEFGELPPTGASITVNGYEITVINRSERQLLKLLIKDLLLDADS